MKKLSRQRLWQLKQRDNGKCIICGRDAKKSRREGKVVSTHCPIHLKSQRGYKRKKREEIANAIETINLATSATS